MRRFEPGDPFAEKREQRDKTADLLHEQAYAHLAVHKPERYAADGIALDEYSYQLFATAVVLADELDVGRFPLEERLSRVLQFGRDTDRLTEAQSEELFHKLVDLPLGVWPDAQKMHEQAGLRKALGKLRDGWEALRSGKASLGASLCQEAAETASRASKRHSTVWDGSEIITDVMESILNPETEHQIVLGVPALNAATGYASPGDVLVIGGATSAGKSTFILEMVIGSIERGDVIGHISTEDDRRRTGRRLLSAYSGVSVLDLKAGVGMERATRWAHHIRDVVGRRWLFTHAPGLSETEICARMTEQARRGARIIVLDYIQSLRLSTRTQDRRNEIGELITILKAHAARLGVLLVVVSQLSRPREGRPQEPTLHDLKEAGELENMADNVLLLWRNRESATDPMNVKLAKGKDGGAGTRWMMRRAAGSGRLVQCEAEIVPFPGGPRRR